MKTFNRKNILIDTFKSVLPLFVTLLIQAAVVSVNAQTPVLDGMWEMYNDKGVKFEKQARIVQSGANLSINNGYGADSTAVLNGSTFTTSDGLTGTVSPDGAKINWNIGYVWVKQVSASNNPLDNTPDKNIPNQEGPPKDSTDKNSADPESITRTVTLKNNGTFLANFAIFRLTSEQKRIMYAGGIELKQGGMHTIGEGRAIPSYDLAEFEISILDIFGSNVAVFRAILPRNKDYTTFCYEVAGDYFNPSVKTCDGSPTYESKHILFKNESGFNSLMRLSYYALGSPDIQSVATGLTTAGFQRKLYLPLNSDTDQPMAIKIENGTYSLRDEPVTLSSFETGCYKVWGSIFSRKASPCVADASARTIKLKNNGAYQAKMQVTYDDGEKWKTVTSNPLEVLEADTVVVPQISSQNPIKIKFLAYDKEFGNPTTVSADFTGELCYKLEGTAFAPTAATCDDTVGDISGKTRQIRFQNDAGYDAQMIVMYFEDQVINGTTISMPKTLVTGMINGLGGKFRLVTIPKNTSKGQSITISLQGNATVKNDIWSTTLPANFTASPQPCFKVTGTLFDPAGGKCNQ